MQTDKRPIYKSVRFWQILISAIVVLGLGIAIWVFAGKGPGSAEQEPVKTAPAETETTEPTLPPLPTNPYSTLDFYLEDGYMTCKSGKSTLGIDVSVWQGDIDWQQVKEAGMEFAMIRVGYRGSNEGTLHEDSMAQTYYQGAKAAGLKVGAYFFSQAVTPEEAVEEADYMLAKMEGWELDMPVVFDWELVSSEARNAKVDARTLTDCILAFSRHMEQAGHTPMVYFSHNHSENGMILPELKDYQFWLAKYDSVMDYPHRVDMWQYTDEGKVPGISGNVDINLWLHYD